MSPGPYSTSGSWLDCDEHLAFLANDAKRQFRFFKASLGDTPGFRTLSFDGAPREDNPQELHTTTRLIHSYALGMLWGVEGAEEIVDQGMRYLATHHLDREHGGFVWSLDGNAISDGRKMAYGHVFVLLAAASAKEAGHPDADELLNQASEVIDAHLWEEDFGLFCDEYERAWTPFSRYRGMNSNMHGVEALLAAFEVTDDGRYLTRAGRILDFFLRQTAPQNGWRIPEHYSEFWKVDESYSGDPMFRPAGTTPGHSFEFGRLALQWWDLSGRKDDGTPELARNLIERALSDAWLDEGGLAYTLGHDGKVAIRSRYWWPVTEAIGALATLIKLEGREDDELWYRRLWQFADQRLIDHARGGWYPELSNDGKPVELQFKGKPDIYHSIQCCLFPMLPAVSRFSEALQTLAPPN
jgi:mannose/cellobiose epimerase-like protein (N-acyl-D-glucosamine 2-epimerase family)